MLLDPRHWSYHMWDFDTIPDMTHPATEHIMQYFTYHHLPEHLQPIAKAMKYVARDMVAQLPEGPELTAGLRKLLEAKDCFVRAALEPKTVLPASAIGCFPPAESNCNG